MRGAAMRFLAGACEEFMRVLAGLFISRSDSVRSKFSNSGWRTQTKPRPQCLWGSQCCRVVVRKRNVCIEELTKSGSVFRCVLLRCRVAHQPQLMPGPSQHCGQPSNPAVVNTWQFEDRAC